MGNQPDPWRDERGKMIPQPEFALVRRGYDPAEVRDFLVEIASNIQTLKAELNQARAAAEAARLGTNAEEAIGSVNTSDPLTGSVDRLIAIGEREAETMLEVAKAEAATMVAEARSEAERIRSDAQGEASRAAEEARAFLEQMQEEANTSLSGLAERRHEVTESLRQTQERLLSYAKDLEITREPVQ